MGQRARRVRRVLTVRFEDARARNFFDGELFGAGGVQLGEAALAADVRLDAAELDVGAPVEFDDVHDERLHVELVVAIGELRHEQDLVVVALGAAVTRSHVAKIIIASSLLARCKCGGDGAADGAAAWLDASPDANVTRSAQFEELWTRAKDGDDDELARLAQKEGARGLEERAASPQHRVTALRAMAFTPGFSSFATLGGAAEKGTDDEAKAAVESADAIAARKREQVDPEDDEELAAGCASLLAAAKNTQRARPIRVGAVRALRMLVDRPKCPKSSEIPTDVDAK